MAELRFLILVNRKGEPVHHSSRIRTEEYGGVGGFDIERALDKIEHLLLVETEQENEEVRDDD